MVNWLLSMRTNVFYFQNIHRAHVDKWIEYHFQYVNSKTIFKLLKVNENWIINKSRWSEMKNQIILHLLWIYRMEQNLCRRIDRNDEKLVPADSL